MALELSIGANVRPAIKGAGDLGDALADVADSLDDVARDAGKSGDKVGDSFTDAARDAERSGDKMSGALKDVQRDGQTAADRLERSIKESNQNSERSFKDLADGAKRSSSDLGTSIGGNIKKGAQEADEGVATAKENIGSNLKEVSASFDGSAQGIADGFQGLIAEVAEGFGPVGLAVGAAAAIGIGLISTAIQGGQEQTEEWKADVAELAQAFIDSGKKGAPGLDYIENKLKALATQTDDSKDSLKKFYDLSKRSDAIDSYDDLAQAVAGVGGNIDDLLAKKREELAATRRQDAADSDSSTSYGAKTSDKAKALQEVVDKLSDVKTKNDEAKEAQDLYVEAGGPELAAKAALVGQVGDAYNDAGGDVETYLDKESGIFDTQGYIDAMQRKQQALQDYAQTLSNSDLTPTAKAYIESLGQEQAATLLSGYKSATPDQQRALNEIWSGMGTNSADTFTDSLNKGLPASVPGPVVKPTLDDSAVRKGLRDIGNGVYSPLINARFSVKVT